MSFHEIDDTSASCVDIGEARRRVDDGQALEIACSLFGDAGIGEIKSLPKAERDAALAKLKASGLTIRQVQRMTGVSLGTISKA